MKKTKRILLTGSGAPGWVPIFHCLMNNREESFDIYGCDIKPQTAGSYYAKRHFTVPSGSDPLFIEHILAICKKEAVDIIIPITDAELLPFALHRGEFSKHDILIPVSSPSSLEIATNKMKLFEWLQKEKLANCTYYLADSLESFKKHLHTLGYPQTPVCFKPAIAWGSRGFRIIDPKKDPYTLLMNEKPNSTYITYEQAIDILKTAETFPELLVMEYLPGDEYTVDVLVNKRKIEYIVPRLRLHMNNGITTEGIVTKNVDIIALSKKIVTGLGLEYAVGIQFKYDKNNQPKVLEINPRLQGTTVISYGAGINIPHYTVRALENKDIPKKEIQYGTHMFRHWQEVFFREKNKN